MLRINQVYCNLPRKQNLVQMKNENIQMENGKYVQS